MGFFDNVKKGARSYADTYKKNSAENKAYRDEVNVAVKKARRDTYKKEAVVQARLKGKILAKQKFNRSPQSSGGGGMTAEARSIIYGSGWGSPTPAKQQVVSHIQKQRSSPKKKKKKKSKTRVVYKTVQPQKDPLHDLLYNS